jgi:Flp pilus assembly protein TadG
MQLIKLAAASPGVHVGIRSPGKRVRARLRTRNEGGQAAVEFALCLPILLIVLTGIFWVGITLSHYLVLTHAVSFGGELLAASRGTPDPCLGAKQAIQNAAMPFLNPTNLVYAITLTPQGGTATNYTTSCPSTTTTLSTGESASVTVTYPCTLPFSIYIIGTLKCTLRAQATELVQ